MATGVEAGRGSDSINFLAVLWFAVLSSRLREATLNYYESNVKRSMNGKVELNSKVKFIPILLVKIDPKIINKKAQIIKTKPPNHEWVRFTAGMLV